MQQTDARTAEPSRTVALALLAQRRAKRGTTATSEAVTALIELRETRLGVLRRRRAAIARRRAASMRAGLRIDGVRQAFTAAAQAA